MHKILLFFLILLSGVNYSQVIREVCSSNTFVYEGEGGDYFDWIELYNAEETFLDLDGWFLTNDSTDLTKWEFPFFTIAPNERKILSFDTFTQDSAIVRFSLKKTGGVLFLVNAAQEIEERILVPALQNNHSYGLLNNRWYFFDTPTPLTENSFAVGYNGYAIRPTINYQSGAYKKGTAVVIRSENSEEIAYYSKDGSQTVFVDGGGVITFALENSISINAVAKGDSLLTSAIAKRTYFVNEAHVLPIINLNIDSLTLFDEVTGIYMLGENAEENLPYPGANYWENVEVPAYYEYFDKDGQLVEALDCDIKIHGGWSRIYPIKSLQLRAKNKYEKNYFEYPYFEDKDIGRFKRLVLRNGGNDYCGTCMKDAAFQKHILKSNLNVDLLGYTPVVVYINGNYWGIQNIREKVDKYYLESNYDVDPTQVNILENDELFASAGTNDDFEVLEDFARTHNLSEEINYEWVENRLDVKSMVDYFIIEFFINNRDWPNHNLKVWNVPGKYKWRYVCYDLDGGFRYPSTDIDDELDFQSILYFMHTFAAENAHVGILKALFDNLEFSRYFVNRYADILNTSFDAEAIFDTYLVEKNRVSVDMEKHYEKWCGSFEQWNERFNGIRGFLKQREGIVNRELATYFNLEAPVAISVNMYPSNAGEIQVNTIDKLVLPFKGNYYPDNLIDLQAIPNIGEIFEYWENTRTGQRFYSKSIQISPGEGDVWVAIFKANKSDFYLNVYPNPIVTNAVIKFELSETSLVQVELTALRGESLQNFSINEEFSTGKHEITVDFANLKQGIYFLTIRSDYGLETTKIFKK